MKVLAIIVTYNRLQLLRRCLSSIKNQTVPPSKIIVINNASTDGTEEYLIENNIHHITQGNVGSAGGWNAGIDYALKNNFDACWLMDDDGFPAYNSLEELLQNISEDESCLSSIVMKEDNQEEFVFPLPILNNSNHPTIFSYPRKIYALSSAHLSSKKKYPFAHLFNGCLIRCSAIAKIGNVNTNFFMMGDEVDYFYRLRKVGKVNSLLSAFHYHPDVTEREYSETKVFYLIKNTIINHNQYLDYPFLRNILLLPLIVIRIIKRNGIEFLLRTIFQKNIFFHALYKGFVGRIEVDKI